MGFQIWVPPSAVAYRCFCGAEFTDKYKGQRHAAECVHRNADLIAADVEELNGNAFTRPAADMEAWEWGRKREGEGRKGFSKGRAA